MKLQVTKQRRCINQFWIVLLAATVLLVSCGKQSEVPKENSDEKAELKLKFENGATWRQWTLTEQTIDQEVMGSKQEIRQVIGIGAEMQVLGVEPNGAATIRYTYDSITFNQSMMGTTISFNSATDTGSAIPEAAITYQAMVGAQFTMKMLPNGTIQELVGLDSLVQRMVEKITAKNPEVAATVSEAIKTMFNNQTLRSNLERSTAIYPTKPVAPGDTWQNAFSISLGIPLNISTDYSVKSLDSKVATVDIRSSITANDQAGNVNISGVLFKYNITGLQTGTMQIDRSSGWVTSSKLQQTLTGYMEMQGVDSSDAIPSKIPMNVSSTITTMMQKK